MLIPVRCYTCNKVLAHLWEEYLAEIQKEFNETDENKRHGALKFNSVTREEVIQKTHEGKILDRLGLHKYCCRTNILTSVDLTTKLT
jgi:DNA-directed RNA polymerase I, II, and III subunit RPABC5